MPTQTTTMVTRERLQLRATATMMMMFIACFAASASAAVVTVTKAPTTTTASCPSAPKGISFGGSDLPSCANTNACEAYLWTCVGGKDGKPPATYNITCGNLQLCYEEYYLCVVASAELAKNTTGDTCSTWGSAIATDLVNYLAGGGKFNSTNTYAACSAYACEFYNATVGLDACPLSYSSICPAISIAPTGGPSPTPVPAGQAATVVDATISLSGDFSVVFSNATAKKQITISLQIDLSNQLGYPVIIISIVEGSLVVNFQASVAASNTGGQAQVIQSVASLNTVPTTWLASTQTAFTAAGGTTTLSAPTVVTLAVSQVTAAPTPAVQDFCGSGCIAGVVVGVVAAAVIVTGIAYVFAQKHAAAAAAAAAPAAAASHEPAADGAAASTEPVEMAPSAPAAV